MSPASVRVSVVVPFYNEAEGVERFYERLTAALGQVADATFEIVCVDDGSSDDTLARLVAVASRDPRWLVIELSRNFGKEAALSAGIDAATGDAVIPIDADLQDPPELIPALIAEWRSGADVVLARRTERSSDSFLKRTTAGLFYRAHNKVSQLKIPENVGDFRLMNRAAVDALKSLPERNRFMKGLFAWVGFRTTTIDYARDPRLAGTTKFSGWKLWNFALEAFTSFSTAPLKLWTYLGGFGAVVATIYAMIIILRTLIYGVDVPGYASLLVVVLFVGSVQLIGIGVLGEYVGRIYLETKQRPGYIVRNRYAQNGNAAEGTSDAMPAASGPGTGGDGPTATFRLPQTRVGLARAGVASTASGASAAPARRGHRRALMPALGIVVIIATTFIYNGWLLDARTFFYADDWQWLWHAEFFPWNEGFTILPSHVYNDRPAGAAFIWALYQLFEFDHLAFQIVMLSLHAVNCVLLYSIATRYMGRGGALLAALLAAVWFSANNAAGYTAALFDLLGATLCLAIVALRQCAIRSRHGIVYDLAGAACLLLAIRTKEIALGMIVVLFLMNVLAERQSVRATLKQLLPYLIVFAVCAARYAQLLAVKAPEAGTPYHLSFSIASITANLGYYLATLFYADSAAAILIPLGLLAGLGAGLLVADENAQRTGLFGLAGYVIMLGPTLLLPAHRDILYNYVPHFFMALAIGSLVGKRAVPTMLGAAISIAVLAGPVSIQPRDHVVNLYLVKGQVNRVQFFSAVTLLQSLPTGATVFIAGVEPIYNPFWSAPGNSLKTAFKDNTINVVVEKPEAELIADYCQRTGPKRFLRFDGPRGTDATGEVDKRCREARSG